MCPILATAAAYGLERQNASRVAFEFETKTFYLHKKTELFTGFHTPPNRSIRAATDYRGGRVRSADMKIF